jgi:hypothetical protein
MPASRAASCLFALRMLPAAAASLVVLLFCVPSYLLFEPAGDAEEVGVWSLGCALLCLLGGGWAIGRTVRAMIRTRQAVDDGFPGVGLIGVFRSRLIVSTRLIEAMPEEELIAAFAHERAHGEARDNLKRLLFLLIPGPKRLEQAWARSAEWAADDRATHGDPGLSLALAAALLRVARLQLEPIAAPLMSTLTGRDSDLEERVNRLLDPNPLLDPNLETAAGVPISAGLIPVVALALFALTGSLGSFHSALEFWMH